MTCLDSVVRASAKQDLAPEDVNRLTIATLHGQAIGSTTAR